MPNDTDHLVVKIFGQKLILLNKLNLCRSL